LPAHSEFSKRERAASANTILLKNQILIRICSLDSEQHILLKQRLIGNGGDPIAFSGHLAMAAVTHFSSAWSVSFFLVLGLAPYILQAFYNFWQLFFLLKKQDSLTHPNSLANVSNS
jgi:hypothetical protein